MLDFILLVTGLFIIKSLYQEHGDVNEIVYSQKLVSVAFPLYSLTWMLSIYFNGGYDKPIKIIKIMRGIFFGSLFILTAYSLLPEYLRFSRALILFGSLWALVACVLLRLVLHFAKINSYSLNTTTTKRIAIIGNESEYVRVSQLLKQTQVNPSFIGFISTEPNKNKHPNYIGEFTQITEIITVHVINEIIFCAKDISSQAIINNMLTLVSSGVDFKIAPPESLSIIGSNHIDTAGDLYIIDVNSITRPENKRNKRMLDISVSTLAILLFPVLILFQKQKKQYFSNCFKVLFGSYSWVGYKKTKNKLLPKIKPSVFSHLSNTKTIIDDEKINLLNLNYAKDYKIETDVLIIWKSLRQIG